MIIAGFILLLLGLLLFHAYWLVVIGIVLIVAGVVMYALSRSGRGPFLW